MLMNNFYVSLRKTTKVNVDEGAHSLPSDRGPFSEYKVADYHCPDEWTKDGIFVEVKEGEPMWFEFRGNDECAILPSIQKLNPVTGEPTNLEGGLTKDPVQNYLRMPEQLWLDGYANDGKVYQFSVTKAGESLAVNEFVLPKHMQDSHALGFAFFGPKNPKPKPNPVRHVRHALWFSPTHTSQSWDIMRAKKSTICTQDAIKQSTHYVGPRGLTNEAYPDGLVNTDCDAIMMSNCIDTKSELMNEFSEPDTIDLLEEKEVDFDKASMGMGGRIDQKIHTDDNTVDYYHEKPNAILTVYLALPDQFKSIMKKGLRQDSKKEDKYIHSGKIGNISIPLI